MTTPQPNRSPIDKNDIPRGTPAGFLKYMKYDMVSGLLVFLIALPLCLGISLASGYPAVAGVFTAIVGAILTTVLSNSELTIKGPAAGLIVIAVGAVTEFGYTGGQDLAADHQAYRMALAVGVAAGIIQIIFGLVRAGILGDFFPTSAVHGMLAAIGVIIILKQLPVAIGQSAKGEPLEILREMPEKFANLNPEIAAIGAVSLIILFGLPLLKGWLKNKALNLVPGPLVVLLVAVPMGMYFDLAHEHTYSFLHHDFKLGEQFLVSVPGNLFKAMAHPDFTCLQHAFAWKWVLMFALIGSLESMLSAKAIDMLDPWKRKTNMDRDLVAVGIANTAVACIGGLPMISEIVRSKANIDNGARTRFADMWHGLFLLGFVALAPVMIHRIPLAALAAMLVYTGFRLASPKEFLNVYKIGAEQLVIFVGTIIAVLATDLLIGIGIGIAIKFAIHVMNGVPIRSLFWPYLEVSTGDDDRVVITARESAVFSNWIPFKRQIERLGLVQKNNVLLDLSGTKLVDHSVMEGLHQLEQDFEDAGLHLDITGLEGHKALSEHNFAARKRAMTRLRRVTVVADSALQNELSAKFVELGASGYTAIPCSGAGRSTLAIGNSAADSQTRIEAVVTYEVADSIMDYLRMVSKDNRLTACLETVEVLKQDSF
ncbi:MAG: SulP family inorganic anion transporter [Planctomycetota bacterium]